MSRKQSDDFCVKLITLYSPDGSRRVADVDVKDPATEVKVATELARTLGLIDALKSGRTSARFPTPKGCTWEQIAISFYSNEAVKITAKGIEKRYTFAEMGFKDGRKGDVPDSRWGILRDGFAKHGEISWGTRLPKKEDQDKLKATVKDIRNRLKEFFGIDDDPFHPYRQVNAYRPRFAIVDLRQGAGDATSERRTLATPPRPDDSDSWRKLLDLEHPLDPPDDLAGNSGRKTSDEEDDRYDELDFR